MNINIYLFAQNKIIQIQIEIKTNNYHTVLRNVTMIAAILD